MTASRTFDLAVIGSGPGGYRAAVLGALRGLEVAIIEQGVWGGTCLNRGCVPKKAWYASARLVAANRGYAARGLAGRLTPDLDQAWRHQRSVVAAVRASYVDYLERLGVTAFTGRATLRTARDIDIAGAGTISAGAVILATGSSPFVPPALALHAGRVLTTDELFDAPPPPGRRVAVIGSGVIGTEMAFILALLGCEVVWLTQSEPLARVGFTPPALALLADALGQHDIRPRRSGRPRGRTIDAEGVTLQLPDGSDERVDWALVASGRRPNVRSLGLEAVNVATDAGGFIATDERTMTAAPGVYAIGDCANARMTSNHALAEAAVAVENIISPGSARRDAAAVPEVIYSALELARLGLSETQAEDAGREPATGFASLEVSPAALAIGEPRGFVRVVADLDSGALLGAEAVGAHAGEWIHAVGATFRAPDALARLAGIRYNHPALAEEILNATETLASKWGLGAVVFGGAGHGTE
ncbi:MAG TPA: NAD(P)/FAD-dependent oxidoreductase [Burkholderiales bacterium]|nr:NAD(P)/FAD-dependent oxidoreductase [Burkholderiales bacterium]